MCWIERLGLILISNLHFYQTRAQLLCAEGTLITLADGSQKPVEDLTMDDMLLVWNHHTGDFDVAPMVFIDSEPVANYEIIHLYSLMALILKYLRTRLLECNAK